MIQHLVIAGVCALCDMMRGGLFGKTIRKFTGISAKIPAMLTVALLYCYTLGFTWWSLIFVIWLPAFAQIMGTGNPMGKLVLGHKKHTEWLLALGRNPEQDWEKYQFTHNGWWTITWLGFIWSFGAVIVAVATQDWNWLKVAGAYTISFPLAGFLARHFFNVGDRWLGIEGLRSGLSMLAVRLI